MFSLSTLYLKTVDGHLPCECNDGKGMLSSVEQAFVGREEIRAPLKTPAWEATPWATTGNLPTLSVPEVRHLGVGGID